MPAQWGSTQDRIEENMNNRRKGAVYQKIVPNLQAGKSLLIEKNSFPVIVVKSHAPGLRIIRQSHADQQNKRIQAQAADLRNPLKSFFIGFFHLPPQA